MHWHLQMFIYDLKNSPRHMRVYDFITNREYHSPRHPGTYELPHYSMNYT